MHKVELRLRSIKQNH